MKYLIVALFAGFLFTGTAEAQDNLVTHYIEVGGICGMCQERIESIATKKGKAETATWSVETKVLKVQINNDKTSIDKIRRVLAAAGHDAPPYLASDNAYNNLHGCCKYRDGDDKSHQDEGIEDEEDQEHEEAKNGGHAEEIIHLSGYISTIENNEQIPLPGANVYLKTGEKGTTTDEKGYFHMDAPTGTQDSLEVSYIGFASRTFALDQEGVLDIILNMGQTLEVVEVSYRRRSTEISFVKTLAIENITEKELCKAACCNLSESFETNPSVDVSYADAVTGTRQIQMLGLAGPNVQIGRELIPDVRGLSSIYGLAMTPGPWIESIQLVKGAGSVVNGFESITGQINVELKKPERGDLFFVNGYINNGGRIELNAVARKKISETTSTALLAHGKIIETPSDRNDDGFIDMPLEKDLVLANRWKFEGKSAFQGQLGMKVSLLNHSGGTHEDLFSKDSPNYWEMTSDIKRYEVWGKIGYINQNNLRESIGLQLGGVMHDQEANFGKTPYDATQKSAFLNLVYQRILNNDHTLRMGASYQYDKVEEEIFEVGNFERSESVPGVYAEYTMGDEKKWSIIPGIRADYHNQYGWFATPRLHAKYNFSDRSIIRIALGRGQRTPSIFAENLGLFSSSRRIVLKNEDSDKPYGLNPEVAWNMGASYTKGFDISGKEFILSLDAYRTNFENQIVVDYENPREVSFYNLEGKSYSNSFQTKIEYELFENFDLRMAYRFYDVKTEYQSGLLQKPFVAQHRAFINAAYETKSSWFFDATFNVIGQQRLPSTSENPAEYQRGDFSPTFPLLNGQIMKRWNDKFDVYIGGENILNYKQEDAIVASTEPYGDNFDASMIWAPVFGSNIYLGFRYRIKE